MLAGAAETHPEGLRETQICGLKFMTEDPEIISGVYFLMVQDLEIIPGIDILMAQNPEVIPCI